MIGEGAANATEWEKGELLLFHNPGYSLDTELTWLDIVRIHVGLG